MGPMRSILNRVLVSASLGHFSVDMYSGMLPVILLGLKPVVTQERGLAVE